jgi:hypothetical protein
VDILAVYRGSGSGQVVNGHTKTGLTEVEKALFDMRLI